MAKVTGRRVPLSLPRRWIADLLRASRGAPIISFERRMNLAPLVAARAAHRISWTALFAKAYSRLSVTRPELRRAYVGFPWPHFFESDMILASIAIEREFAGESAVFFGIFREAQKHPLPVLQRGLERWKMEPVTSVRQYQRILFYTKIIWPLRRLLWWYGITSSGRRRARNCGTFGISSTAGTGATALNIIAPVATTINYSPFHSDGTLDVRLHFDHRVMDGLLAAKVLEDLEAVLNGPIRDEVASLLPQVTVTPAEIDECEYLP